MAPKNEGLESTVGVLEIKLGACLTAPTKRAVADLHNVGVWCNHARNGMMRHWERWREDNLDWKPQQRTDRKGNAKTGKRITVAEGFKKRQVLQWLKNGELIEKEDGSLYHMEVIGGDKKKGKATVVATTEVLVGKNEDTAILEHPAYSQALENEMYARGTAVAPSLACSLVASLRSEVLDRLKMKMPYTHVGEAKFRWEAILKYEVARDSFRSIHIPAPNSCTVLAYQGNLSRTMSKGIDERLKAMSVSSALLRIVCFSREAKRNSEHIFRVEVRQLPRGKRAILRRIATQEWKLCDSRLVFKRNNWFFQLTYKQPVKDLGLNKDHLATLLMNPKDSKNPLSIRWTPAPSTVVQWQLGDAVVLSAEYGRLLLRRIVLQNRYSTAGSGRKGHGKKRAFRSMKPLTRRANDLMEVFSNNMVAQIIKFCVRHDCGTVLYREPSKMLRQFSWFEGQKPKMPFNWTGLLAKIQHKLFLNGIVLVVERMGCKEHRQFFKTDDPNVSESSDEITASDE